MTAGIVHPGKGHLRARLLDARARRPDAERTEAAEALCRRVLELPELVGARAVGCYASTAEEPGTRSLIARLHERGVRVLLPIVLPDFDLDWAVDTGAPLALTRIGLSEPTGDRLGPAGIATADVVVCPGLAADPRGNRLGRGAGCYDRALARLDADTPRVLVLFDDEVLAAVPATEHDQPVDVIVTPARTIRTKSATEHR